MRTVEGERITGSLGRYKDFDRSFLPRKMSMGERWNRVDSAYHEGVELPAVSLFKVGDEYLCAQSMLVQLIVPAMSRKVALGKLAAWRSSFEAAQRTRIAMG